MGMETKHEAATHFVEAGLVLKREDPKGRHGGDPGREGGRTGAQERVGMVVTQGGRGVGLVLKRG